MPRILDADASRAGRAKDLGHELQPLGDAAGDDHVIRGDARPARTVQIAGQGVPQLRHATATQVPESVRGRRCQHAAKRPQPRRARELVGRQVVRGGSRSRSPVAQLIGRRLDRARDASDARGSAGAADQVALGGELLVRRDDDAARHAELRGEGTGRWEGRVRVQSSSANRVAQRLLELPIQRELVVAAERKVELQL